LVIWDGLPGHSSTLEGDFVAAQGDRLALERLPGYAPELKPVEIIWSCLNHTNCPRELWQLSVAARDALRWLRRRSTFVVAFQKQAELSKCHLVM